MATPAGATASASTESQDRILRHQIVQKSCATTRQAEQKDWRLDMFINYPKVVFFFGPQP